MSSLVTGYAQALLGVAQAESALDRVIDELFHFAKALESNNELRTALADIGIPAERKTALLDELFGDKASDVTRNLVALVVAQNHVREIPAIVEELETIAATSRNRVVAEVRSAVALDASQIEKLAVALNKATGKIVEVKVVVDPSVIGGIYAKVGDQVIDGTVRRSIAALTDLVAQG